MVNKYFLRQLRDYQKRVKDWLAHKDEEISRNLYNDERNTTVKFIAPLFNILGWNHLSRNVEYEHTVRCKKLKMPKHVDIALYTKDSKKPKIFVEIKRIQDELGTGRQLLRYLHAEKVKYGIYTNGREIRLLDNRTPIKYVPEGLFIIKVEDFIRYNKVLAVLSKKAVDSGKLDRIARSFHDKERFWKQVENKEKKVKRSERKKLKYYLRLEYANKQL